MLSIIIACHNDQDNLNHTLDSLFNSVDNIECIVIDDGSSIPIKIGQKYQNKVILIKNDINIGHGPSRCLGVEIASNPYIMYIDSHTYFPKGWYSILEKKLNQSAHNNILYFPMKVLQHWSECNKDNPTICYGGKFFEYNHKNKYDFWGSYPIYNKHETNCLKLASCVINKNFFTQIRGTSDTKKWGSDELYLTVKTIMVGGTIEMIPEISLGHIESRICFVRDPNYTYYNMLRLAKTFSNESKYNDLLNIIPQNNKFINRAKELLLQDDAEIQEYKDYYKSISVKEVSWLK